MKDAARKVLVALIAVATFGAGATAPLDVGHGPAGIEAG